MSEQAMKAEKKLSSGNADASFTTSADVSVNSPLGNLSTEHPITRAKKEVQNIFERWRKSTLGSLAASSPLEPVEADLDRCVELLLRIAKLRRYAPEKKPLNRWSMIMKVDREYPGLGVLKRFEDMLACLEKVPPSPDLRILASGKDQSAKQAEFQKIERLLNEPEQIETLDYQELLNMYPHLIELADERTRRLLDSCGKEYVQSGVSSVTPMQLREALGPSQAFVSYRILRNLGDDLHRWTVAQRSEKALAEKLVALNWPEALDRLRGIFPGLLLPKENASAEDSQVGRATWKTKSRERCRRNSSKA